VLAVDRAKNEVRELALNPDLPKDQDNVKIVFQDMFLYADYQYKALESSGQVDLF
jgi:hypothetical protein